LALVKIVQLANIHQMLELQVVLLVDVVKKLLLMLLLVIFVLLVNILMEVNANNVRITLILLMQVLALVILVNQVIK